MIYSNKFYRSLGQWRSTRSAASVYMIVIYITTIEKNSANACTIHAYIAPVLLYF